MRSSGMLGSGAGYLLAVIAFLATGFLSGALRGSGAWLFIGPAVFGLPLALFCLRTPWKILAMLIGSFFIHATSVWVTLSGTALIQQWTGSNDSGFAVPCALAGAYGAVALGALLALLTGSNHRYSAEFMKLAIIGCAGSVGFILAFHTTPSDVTGASPYGLIWQLAHSIWQVPVGLHLVRLFNRFDAHAAVKVH